MKKHQLEELRKWFASFITRHRSDNLEINELLNMKIEHTAFICDNTKEIIKTLNWTQENVLLAETIALLHDIGRFPQVNTYNTFNDKRSFDHASLSVELLLQENVLDALPAWQQRVILSAVKWHNKRSVPLELPFDEQPFILLVRDADILDNLRILVTYFKLSPEQQKMLLEKDLPSGTDCSEKIALEILSNNVPNLTKAQNIIDVSLIKLSWMFALNFPSSKQILLKRKHLEEVLDILPKTSLVKKVGNHLKNHLKTI